VPLALTRAEVIVDWRPVESSLKTTPVPDRLKRKSWLSNVAPLTVVALSQGAADPKQ
jgi:hypothetical protein